MEEGRGPKMFRLIRPSASAFASARMRLTMATRPLERCVVRCSRSPSRSKIAIASVAGDFVDRAAGIERDENCDQAAHDHRIRFAAIGEHRPPASVCCLSETSHTCETQPFTLLSALRSLPVRAAAEPGRAR